MHDEYELDNHDIKMVATVIAGGRKTWWEIPYEAYFGATALERNFIIAVAKLYRIYAVEYSSRSGD